MNTSAHIAKNLREVYLSGNWTASNLKSQLKDVNWKEATTQYSNLNSIATLVHHMTYYVTAVAAVLKGGVLNAKDELSFDHPPIENETDWQAFLTNIFNEVEGFADLVEQLPESKLWETFEDDKYGNYYRNLQGIVEHCHYHLGQIAIIKKLLKE
ncbi:MAG: DUF1572 domain-containing protein [Flavobacteriaceae bacterium]|nr:DUF1572 domain-containing protein [Flavobacteriaceae bacterium]